MPTRHHLDLLYEHSLLIRIGGDFSIAGVIRDILEASLNSEQKKRFFQQLVDQYEKDANFDTNDAFYFPHYVSTCLNAERRELAERLLSSFDYLLCRFFKIGLSNLFSDFEAVLSQKPSLAITSFRNFFSTLHLWNQDFNKETLLRQALLFRRGDRVDMELQSLTLKENITLPLFQIESQQMQESQGYKEVSRLDADRAEGSSKILALRGDGFALVIQGEVSHESSGEWLH